MYIVENAAIQAKTVFLKVRMKQPGDSMKSILKVANIDCDKDCKLHILGGAFAAIGGASLVYIAAGIFSFKVRGAAIIIVGLAATVAAATLKELWDDRTSDLGADWEFDFWNSILGGVVGATISWAILTAFKSPLIAGLITVICTAILGDEIIDELIKQINERKNIKQWNY